MNTPSEEKRSGKDRRKEERIPGLRYLLMGKRGGPRRKEEKKSGYYVEVYGSKIFIASFALIFLAIMDALFTLHHVEHGAKEVNPGMDFLLRKGVDEFFYVKYTLTCLAVLFLCLHKNFRYVREVLIALIFVYMLVNVWHLYLLSIFG